ncbi:MAG: hypothetical protein IPK63_16495 [Candidatus Competibacteraceae bacterium]|nr:hypothetical protein [Candidatus Competibacteraceae bacterium]
MTGSYTERCCPITFCSENFARLRADRNRIHT